MEQTLEQVWFTGAHSDVGGGYAESELGEITLCWMAEKAAAAGLAFDPDSFRPLQADATRRERATAQVVHPDPKGPCHNSLSPLYRVTIPIWRPIPYVDRKGLASSLSDEDVVRLSGQSVAASVAEHMKAGVHQPHSPHV